MKNSFVFIVLLICMTFAGNDPATQEVGSWVFQYRKADMGDVTHPYECGFVWDSKNDVGLVFSGHLGTYFGQPEDELVNIMNTNMTYAFSFSNSQFHKVQPSLRPPKRCGVKIVYDDSWNRLLAVGGGYHNFDNSYGEPSLFLSKLATEGAESDSVPRTLAMWSFDAETGQWYHMRALQHAAPAGRNPHGGYGSNYCFSTEYGLALLAPTNSGRVHAYAPYLNQWVLLPENYSDPERPMQEDNICAAYDLKNRRMVWLNANTGDTVKGVKTWAYDIGTKVWTKLPLLEQPTRSIPEWYNSYGAMAYDRKNATIVYLHTSGAETWTLHSDSNSWVKKTTTTHPASCGNMGEGMTYDQNRNVILAFTNTRDEVWTYKTGNGIAGRPNAPTALSGITTASGINLTWSAPTGGVTPNRYRIYRAAWDDNKSNGSAIVPYSYILVDSTTGHTFTDNSDTLKAFETFHSYFVEAVSVDNQVSDPSTPAYTKLRVPFGLVATPYSANQVVLRWKPKKESDFIGYNVYRYQRFYPYQRQMLSKRINTSIIAEPFFVDTTVRLCGTPLCADSLAMYCVTAVNRLGKESGLSPYATTAPDWPTNFWADTVNKVISWSPPRCGNIANYRVYSAFQRDWNTGSTNMNVVDVTTDTFWNYGAQPSVMCYKVRAYSRMGQLGHFSDVLAIQTKDSLHFGMYKLDFQAERPVYDTFYDDVPSIAVEKAAVSSLTASLLNATPNPFNPTILFTLSSRLKEKGELSLAIYSVNGKLAAKMPFMKIGDEYLARWNGERFSSGIYIVSINLNGKTIRKTITLTK